MTRSLRKPKCKNYRNNACKVTGMHSTTPGSSVGPLTSPCSLGRERRLRLVHRDGYRGDTRPEGAKSPGTQHAYDLGKSKERFAAKRRIFTEMRRHRRGRFYPDLAKVGKLPI